MSSRKEAQATSHKQKQILIQILVINSELVEYELVLLYLIIRDLVTKAFFHKNLLETFFHW